MLERSSIQIIGFFFLCAANMKSKLRNNDKDHQLWLLDNYFIENEHVKNFELLTPSMKNHVETTQFIKFNTTPDNLKILLDVSIPKTAIQFTLQDLIQSLFIRD